MKNVYALYVAPDTPHDLVKSLGDALTTSERLTGWWNHLPCLYLLESESDASVLSKMVGKILKPWSFLVVKVDLANVQGWMPDRGWPWITSRLTEDSSAMTTKALAD